MRQISLQRTTNETDITLSLKLEGSGSGTIKTGIGFFDHMLNLLQFHAQVDLSVEANGDTWVDAHHTVEDVGILLGQALKEAVGDCRGIERYGSAYVPMDETLARVVLDLSGRPYVAFHATFTNPKLGDFDSELTEEFFRALANHSRMTLHLDVLRGTNTHHQIEALFKAFARALRVAVRRSGDVLPSTKGWIET